MSRNPSTTPPSLPSSSIILLFLLLFQPHLLLFPLRLYICAWHALPLHIYYRKYHFSLHHQIPPVHLRIQLNQLVIFYPWFIYRRAYDGTFCDNGRNCRFYARVFYGSGRIKLPPIHLMPSNYPACKPLHPLLPSQWLLPGMIYIAFSASRVAKFTSKPRESQYWTAVKRIFRYFAGTPTMGISYFGSISYFSLRGYYDVDYAGNHDDKNSRTGYLLIYSCQQRCHMVQQAARLYCNLHYRGRVCCLGRIHQGSHLAQTLAYYPVLDFLKPTLFLLSRITNQGSIQLVKNPRYHKRPKHIETKLQLADLLTNSKLSFVRLSRISPHFRVLLILVRESWRPSSHVHGKVGLVSLMKIGLGEY